MPIICRPYLFLNSKLDLSVFLHHWSCTFLCQFLKFIKYSEVVLYFRLALRAFELFLAIGNCQEEKERSILVFEEGLLRESAEPIWGVSYQWKIVSVLDSLWLFGDVPPRFAMLELIEQLIYFSWVFLLHFAKLAWEELITIIFMIQVFFFSIEFSYPSHYSPLFKHVIFLFLFELNFSHKRTPHNFLLDPRRPLLSRIERDW